MTSAALPILTPRERQPGGCCEAVVVPDLDAERAASLAVVGKALGDATRLQILDALRKAEPEAICQCELVPLFEMSQAAVAKHLKVLTSAGLVDAERRGAWTYYFLPADTPIKELMTWLS